MTSRTRTIPGVRKARHELGVRLHRTIEAVVARRVAHQAEGIREAIVAELVPRAVADAVAEVRHRALRDHHVFGPPDRLKIAASATVNDALFNTVSGHITVGDHVFFGHGVSILTGSHDTNVIGPARSTAIPASGHDVTIEEGAWISSRALVLGPCRIGAHAVVAAGAVVSRDVPDGAIVAGVPARVVSRVNLPVGVPPAVDLETDVGRLFAHADDEVITPVLRDHGGMPDDDLQLLSELVGPGDTVVDVGANIGYSTLTLAGLVGPEGRVIAIEPHAGNLQLLRANVGRNGMEDRVTVVAAAAMNAAGTVSLAACEENSGDHRVRDDAGDRRTFDVPAVTVDELVEEGTPVRLLLLDTQGTEHHALTGAATLLERDRPTILVEFWPHGIADRGDDPGAALAQYRAAGYAISVVEDPALNDLDDDELTTRVDRRPGPSGGFVTLRLDPA